MHDSVKELGAKRNNRLYGNVGRESTKGLNTFM